MESSELDRLVNEIAELNLTFFPTHIFIVVLAVVLTMLCYLRPSLLISKSMNLFLAILYAIMAYGVTVCYINLQGPYYLFTAVIQWGVSLLFFLSIFKGNILFKLPVQKDLRILSVILTAYGIFIYPLVEYAMGYTWPGIFVFGAICPTTVFSIGVLIMTAESVGKSKAYTMLLALISLGAVICATRTILIGGVFDISYLASGIIGFYSLYKYGFKKNNPSILKGV